MSLVGSIQHPHDMHTLLLLLSSGGRLLNNRACFACRLHWSARILSGLTHKTLLRALAKGGLLTWVLTSPFSLLRGACPLLARSAPLCSTRSVLIVWHYFSPYFFLAERLFEAFDLAGMGAAVFFAAARLFAAIWRCAEDCCFGVPGCQVLS